MLNKFESLKRLYVHETQEYVLSFIGWSLGSLDLEYLEINPHRSGSSFHSVMKILKDCKNIT